VRGETGQGQVPHVGEVLERQEGEAGVARTGTGTGTGTGARAGAGARGHGTGTSARHGWGISTLSSPQARSVARERRAHE